MRSVPVLLVLLLALSPLRAAAQDQQTLADIRQELTVLFVEVQRLKRELSTTGSPSAAIGGGSVLDRVKAIEAQLTRLTARTEQLENRVDRVVRDGTNRIGDLEFRLVELEGGDVSQLGETTTLGGGDLPQSATVVPPGGGTTAPGSAAGELAVGEAQDFKAANDAFAAGDYETAVTLLQDFNRNYPGSPVAAEASLKRGLALNQLGDTREAARAFLEGYSVDPTGPLASQSVLALGTALGQLGSTREACLTLGEIPVRYAGTPEVALAQAEMARLGCS